MAAVGVEPVEPPFLSVCVLEDLFDAPAIPGEAMDPNLWSLLSTELQEMVLLVLPASSQARFRGVCKEWLNLLTSKPFRARTAALAFYRGHYFCGVSHSSEEDASELKNPRYKVHKVSLEFLPSELQGPATVSQQGLLVIPGDKSSTEWHRYGGCIMNPVNQTYRVLPRLGSDWEPPRGVCVEESAEGDFSFRAYAEGSYEKNDHAFPEVYGTVYRSDSNAWQQISMVTKARRTVWQYVGMLKDVICFADGWGKIDVDVYSQKSGKLVHSFPPWQQEAIAHVNFSAEGEKIVALAFSTTAENVCEVWKVDSSSTAWVKLAVMPHGVLWPSDDAHFFSVRFVELVGNVAFISFLRLDKPVHTWVAFDAWTRNRPIFPTYDYLVAFDVVQASWRFVCDRWPCLWRYLMQLNPALDVSCRG